MSDCCDICGIGFYLPSRVCDHCDSKADDHPNAPRPIDTAPKDGTRLLLFYEGVWVAASWWKSQEQWMDDDFNYSLSRSELTHWLPMPPDPTT